MGTTPGVRRLLVPLTDGADEATLQAIADVARGAGSVVRLLYIRPLPSGAASEAESASHLDAAASSLGDIPVERVVRFGDLETAVLGFQRFCIHRSRPDVARLKIRQRVRA